jgi:hypothetical protein
MVSDDANLFIARSSELNMGIFPSSGYISLTDARDILMRRMYEGVTPSEEIEKYRSEGGLTSLTPNGPWLPLRPSASPSCWVK